METREVGPAEVARMLAEQQEDQRQRLKAGIPALDRLVEVARRDTGQSRVCGRFLLGLYNGGYYRFNLNDLRGLDTELLDDCLAVLRMDARPVREVHQLIEGGEAVFRSLRMAWATGEEAERFSEDDRAEWTRRHG